MNSVHMENYLLNFDNHALFSKHLTFLKIKVRVGEWNTPGYFRSASVCHNEVRTTADISYTSLVRPGTEPQKNHGYNL